MMRLVNYRPMKATVVPTVTRAKTWTSRSNASKIDQVSSVTYFSLPRHQIKSSQRTVVIGKATPEGTENYFRRLKDAGVRLTPEMKGWSSGSGFTTSRVGFGGYRVSFGDPAHRDAITYCLENGCNIIDTSSNYEDGESESLIGEIISIENALKKIRREEVVVVTKGGYIQGSIAHEVDKRQADGNPYHDVVELGNGNKHCISADFIRNQLTQSLKRLRLTTVDAYLIHNPEYFFKPYEGKVKAGTMQHKRIQDDFYHVLKKTFEALEDEVKKGRIQYYGISSNTFATPKDHFSHVSLERTLEVAQWVDDRHHYKVIEFPMNVLEPQPLLIVNNGDQTLLDYASTRGFMTLSNRPLNADHPRAKGLVRLADTSLSHKGFFTLTVLNSLDKDLIALLSESFNLAIAIEKSYLGLQKPDDPFLPNYKEVSWAQILGTNSEQFTDPSLWEHVLRYQIRPSLDKALFELANNKETKAWAIKYRAAMSTLLQRFGWMVEANHSSQIRQINKFLNVKFPIMSPTQYQFSDKVVDLMLNTKVDVVLMGLRRPMYAKEFFPSHPFPALPKEHVYEGLKDLYDFLRAPPKPKEQGKDQKKEPTESKTA